MVVRSALGTGLTSGGWNCSGFDVALFAIRCMLDAGMPIEPQYAGNFRHSDVAIVILNQDYASPCAGTVEKAGIIHERMQETDKALYISRLEVPPTVKLMNDASGRGLARADI